MTRAKRDVFEPLVADGAFDYYETFDTKGTAVSGVGRYGEVPPVLGVATYDSEQWVEGRFETMTSEMERHADRIDDYFSAVDGDYSDLWEQPGTT